MIIMEPGRVLLGRYEVVNYIDAGGMQEVYKARDLSLNRYVALKTPKTDSAERRFLRSAQTGAMLFSHHLASTLDYFVEDRRQYLVEELVVGEDLEKVMRHRYDFLDPHMVAHVFHCLAKGVLVAHRRQIVHRDLKPKNILVSDPANFDKVKITDFGIAKLAEIEIQEAISGDGENQETSMSNSSTAVGALPYMSPEIIEMKGKVGLSTDVWSLGAIAYRLLCGEPPFGTGFAAIKKILNHRELVVPQWSTKVGQYSRLVSELFSIISDCLVPCLDKRLDAERLHARLSGICYSKCRHFDAVVVSQHNTIDSAFFVKSEADQSTIFLPAESMFRGFPEVGGRVCIGVSPGEPYKRAFPCVALKGEAQDGSV